MSLVLFSEQRFRVCCLIVLTLATGLCEDVLAQSVKHTLTTIRDVRSLSPEEADKAYPVRIEGVITYCWPGKIMCYMQNGEDAIFIRHLHESYEPGTYVQVSGHTTQGWFAPDIADLPDVNVLGRRPLPDPSQLSPHYLYIGKEDARWVETEGIVRSVQVIENDAFYGLIVMLDSYGNDILVQINESEIPDKLVGAFVKLRGVASGTFNPEMELTGISLRMDSFDFLEVITPGFSDNQEDVPICPIRSVFTFSLDPDKNQYVHVEGTVILIRQGKDILIQDETGAIYIQTDEMAHIQLEDSVSVIGFPVFDSAYLRIEDASLHILGRSTFSPEPHPVDSVSLVANSSLVKLKATLHESVKIDSTIIYQLSRDSYRFNAQLTSSSELPVLRPGSILELTGVAELLYDQREVKAPELDPLILHLRNPEDIVILTQGPWWTTAHTRWFIIGLVLTVVLIISWVVLLRRQIDEQTEEIKAKSLSLEAAYEEAQAINNNLIETNKILELSMDQLRDTLDKNKEILGITAHDLKNPLGGIIGLAEMIIEDFDHGVNATYESAVDNIPMLKGEAERMLQIIKDLLDRHRDGEQVELKKEMVLVGDIVSAVIRWNTKQATNKRIQLHYSTEEAVVINVDLMSIQRVLDNYVSNAIKYSPPQSNVWIVIKKVPVMHNGHSWVKISVRDEGPGLTDEDKQKVFGKMQRLSATPTAGEHSTGLGLFIVKQLVEAHGGKVGVDSGSGKGATFWFEMPAVEINEALEESVMATT